MGIREAVEIMDGLGQGRDIHERCAFGHPMRRHHEDRPRTRQIAAQFRPGPAVFGILNRVHRAAMTEEYHGHTVRWGKPIAEGLERCNRCHSRILFI